MTAVAFGIFDFGGKLGGGAAMFGQEKVRIVTETVFTGGFSLPLSVPDAFGDDGLRIVFVAHKHQHADVIAAFIGVIGQVGGKFGIVGGIGFRFAGVACRQYARCAAERVGTDAAVVGKGRQAAVFGGMAGFGECVFHEGKIRLRAFGRVKRGLRQDFDAFGGKQLAKFF